MIDAGGGPADRTERALARAEELERAVAPFALLTPDLARAQAARLEDDAPPGPVCGRTLAVKDVIDVGGVPTRLGTPGAGHHTAAQSAVAVARLVAAGAIVVGKATTHELAFGMVTPQTRNPFDARRIVGGSSGGSAAAVAAGVVDLALGTDTNGSVRCPAALCGVVGLRPTSGTISRAGVAPLAWSQDTVGLLAPTAEDCAAALPVVAGPGSQPEGATRVVVDPASWAPLQAGVERACRQALDDLAAAGVEVVEQGGPDHVLAGSASIAVLMAEAAAAWQRTLATAPEGFGPQVRAALRAGASIPATTYLRAKQVRASMLAELRVLLGEARAGALVTPTLPVTAAPAGAVSIALGGREQPVDAVHSRFTALASLVGAPAVSVPCGLDETGLPVGLQLVGAPGADHELLRLARRVEETTGGRAVSAARRMGAGGWG